MIDYDKYRKSLKHLQMQYANYQQAQGRRELREIMLALC